MKEKAQLSVGDKVSFTINSKDYVDTVTYIIEDVVEGEVYDLTRLYRDGKLKVKDD